MNRMSRRTLNRARELARPDNLGRAPSTQPRDTAPAREWYRFTNEAGSDTTTIYIYDYIDSFGGYWGVSAQEFIAELMQVTTPNITLRVNSPGGEVFEALAMFAVLESHPANVTAIVDSLAASAASFLILAADTVKIHRNAQLMIHDAIGICIGNAADMAEMKLMLDMCSDNIASIYAEKAGGTTEEWRAVMQGDGTQADGKWYTAQEALDAGLVDEIMTRTEETDDGEGVVPGGTEPVPADAAGTRVTAAGGSDTGNTQTPEPSPSQAPDPDAPGSPADPSPPVGPSPEEPGASTPEPDDSEEGFELPEALDLVALIQQLRTAPAVPNQEGAA